MCYLSKEEKRELRNRLKAFNCKKAKFNLSIEELHVEIDKEKQRIDQEQMKIL